MENNVRAFERLRLMDDMENTNPEKFENYDVFISHRGPDTKTGFVSFLYKDLKAAGLQPFLDCKSIGIGENSWECIARAIKKTPIAVVIFSERFADSEWCLRELHAMLHTPGVSVLPIFYNVRPSEVRFPLSGQLKDGFEKLTRRHNKTVIEQWRADLEQSSKLMGWEHSGAHRRLEGELVTEIVGKICELANKLLPLDVGDYVFGVKRVAKKIIQKLNKKKTVVMLGLWGMGGIGKSTLARELYNRLSKRFAASCYVEDVTEKVIQGGVVKVQNRILKDLCRNESEEIEDVSKGKTILEERLRGKRILLVLDDVRDNDEMEYWIPRKMLSEGSLCIVTSRNRRVFEKSNSFNINHEILVHHVQGLTRAISEQVFASHAFRGYWKVKPGFENLVANISKACGGVPLVLKVCGALLKDEEDVDSWEELKKKLNCGTIMDEKKIFECLRMSYDALQEEHQEMFLDIACALLGESVDMAKRVWKSYGWSAALGIRSLVEKALITVDYGDFRMHDHLRDMGREIVRKKRASEGVSRRLWMPQSLVLLKEDERLPDSLQTLIITNSGTSHLDVSCMKDLRILICDDTTNVTSSLPKHLRWFSWKGPAWCFQREMMTFPIAFRNNKLVTLDLKRSRIQSLPESTGDLSDLEVLDLSYCENLITLPDSFERLKNLRDLKVRYSGIESLPESFGELSNLEVLNLSSCKNLIILPDLFGGLRNLRDVKLEDSGVESLPESFGQLSSLKVLNVRHCRRLVFLPNSLMGLKNLLVLYLEGSALESLLMSSGDLSHFKRLNMSAKLSNLLEVLKNQRKLDLAYFKGESLPKSFEDLRRLEVVNLSHCKNLAFLPDSFGDLRMLRDLKLEDSGIQSLPESFGNLSNLEVLHVKACYRLFLLPDSFGGLGNLMILRVEDSGIRRLPESFGKLSNLEELNLWCCKNLVMLPDSFCSLRNLRRFTLGWTYLRSLPESFGELSNLQDLDLFCCWGLMALPQSLTQLKNLQKLDLQNCPASRTFKSLRHLMPGDCEVKQ